VSRVLRLLFLTSLLANGLLVGVVLGGGLPHPASRGAERDARIEQITRRLPEAVQARFRERMAQIRADDDARREQIREARQRAIAALGAPAFDAAAYDREVAAIDALRGQRARDTAAAVRELAVDLPQEQRRVLAEVLNRPPRPR
jgi:uncharacterized membrane protein